MKLVQFKIAGGKDIVLNVDHIISLQPSQNSEGPTTVIQLTHDLRWIVVGSMHENAAKLV